MSRNVLDVESHCTTRTFRYYHELFLRGRPDLCRLMVRTRVKGNGMVRSTRIDALALVVPTESLSYPAHAPSKRAESRLFACNGA